MNKKVLLTFAGNTDPTRGQHDGPIIHICRYYKPEKIYLILTKEMEERDEAPYNIYEKAIKENLKDYAHCQEAFNRRLSLCCFGYVMNPLFLINS